ncbi:sialidase family protein [[Mycoplasma] testudinis]|uniref:sialidase family protein n=1 Tax=[Mycoplasma] testudinis TaxID=33924 RepID=UPI00047F5779|nr:sialidase family protein [[Mycoplasma] testudinis]
MPPITTIVFGPGKALELQHQKDPALNGNIIVPLYEFGNNGGLRQNAYYAIINPKTNQISTSNYLLGSGGWTSESQIVEYHDGTLIAMSRNSTNGSIAISKSIDGGKTFTDLDGSLSRTSNFSIGVNNNTQIGLTNFYYQGNDYTLFSLPSNQTNRVDGAIYLVKNYDFDKPQKIYSFPKGSFQYSSLAVIDITNQTLKLGTLYERWVSGNSGPMEVVYNIFDIQLNQ